MYLIYGKGKVGNALKELCDYKNIPAEIKDDADKITDFSHYEAIIPSPGVPPTNPIYKTGKIIWELDFAYWFLPKNFKIISITGTDGKSTTTWIMYNILRQEFGDEKVFISGNFDLPLSTTVLEILKKWLKSGYIVAEISSFMAYNIKNYTSDYSIFTNFETDHLNWHSDMRDYFLSKWKVCENTRKTCILHESIEKRIKELNVSLSSSKIRYYGGAQTKLNNKDYVSLPDIVVSGRKKYSINKTKFSGIYNAQNILACTLVANEMKICSKRTTKYLKTIGGLPHRIELYKEIRWAQFIDDSKSTSAQSLRAALGSFDKPVILIAGGSDKGDPFVDMEDIFAKQIKHAELIGQTREILGAICERSGTSHHYSESMQEAVEKAFAKAKKWDVVLLSPGCASFGLFKDYLDRANKFKEAVDLLK